MGRQDPPASDYPDPNRLCHTALLRYEFATCPMNGMVRETGRAQEACPRASHPDRQWQRDGTILAVGTEAGFEDLLGIPSDAGADKAVDRVAVVQACQEVARGAALVG